MAAAPIKAVRRSRRNSPSPAISQQLLTQIYATITNHVRPRSPNEYAFTIARGHSMSLKVDTAHGRYHHVIVTYRDAHVLRALPPLHLAVDDFFDGKEIDWNALVLAFDQWVVQIQDQGCTGLHTWMISLMKMTTELFFELHVAARVRTKTMAMLEAIAQHRYKDQLRHVAPRTVQHHRLLRKFSHILRRQQKQAHHDALKKYTKFYVPLSDQHPDFGWYPLHLESLHPLGYEVFLQQKTMEAFKDLPEEVREATELSTS